MVEKRVKTCSSCETKYTITWDLEVQDLTPITCPFCGFETNDEEDIEDETVWTNDKEDTDEDDNWN
jgi:DNA-directed RNA polymerase subunit RPC12/RpoP